MLQKIRQHQEKKGLWSQCPWSQQLTWQESPGPGTFVLLSYWERAHGRGMPGEPEVEKQGGEHWIWNWILSFTRYVTLQVGLNLQSVALFNWQIEILSPSLYYWESNERMLKSLNEWVNYTELGGQESKTLFLSSFLSFSLSLSSFFHFPFCSFFLSPSFW